MKIAIIIPTLNEAQNIALMIDVIMQQVFPKVPEIEMHLLVVDDCSPDGTAEIVEAKRNAYRNLHLLKGKRQGLGNACIMGMKYAQTSLQTDAIVEMDGDFQHMPSDILRLVDIFLQGADVVIGSRYIGGSIISTSWPAYRRAISQIGNTVLRFILGVDLPRDITSGLKLTRVHGVLDGIDLNNIWLKKRFAYKIVLLHHLTKQTCHIVEIPIQFNARRRGDTKFRLFEILATIGLVIRLKFGDFVKSPISALRFILRHCGVP